MMPQQKRGKSKQSYGTPEDFIAAAEKRFGKLTIDLAASEENAVCGAYITKEQDSLSVDWTEFQGLGWLNPEFAKIGPWAEKCGASASARFRILMLVPAAVDSNWFAKHVHGKALVFALSPRLTFVGEKDPYIKGLLLCCYGFGVAGFDLWRWREKRKRVAKTKPRLVESEAAE